MAVRSVLRRLFHLHGVVVAIYISRGGTVMMNWVTMKTTPTIQVVVGVGATTFHFCLAGILNGWEGWFNAVMLLITFSFLLRGLWRIEHEPSDKEL